MFRDGSEKEKAHKFVKFILRAELLRVKIKLHFAKQSLNSRNKTRGSFILYDRVTRWDFPGRKWRNQLQHSTQFTKDAQVFRVFHHVLSLWLDNIYNNIYEKCKFVKRELLFFTPFFLQIYLFIYLFIYLTIDLRNNNF